MQRAVLALVLTAFCPIFAAAGVTYEFRSVSTGLQRSDMRGTVSADRGLSRIDFRKGDGLLFRDGTYAVSRANSQIIRVADSAAKTYFEIDMAAILGSESPLRSFGNLVKLEVANPKVSARDRGDGGTIGGYPTRRRSISASYDVLMNVIGEQTTAHVSMETESWITTRLPKEYASFLQSKGVRTGIEAVDKLLAAQAEAADGFPMRSTTTIRVRQDALDARSSTTTTISGVATRPIPASIFEIPAGYTRVANPIEKMMKRVR